MSGITAISGIQATELAALGGGRSQTPVAAPSPAAATTTAATQLGPNPSLRIDAALAMVVIEFHGTSGAVENSIPTAQQLDAYRRTQGADHAAAKQTTSETTSVGAEPLAEQNQTSAPRITA